MDIPVLIQPVPGKGFVATAPAFGWSAEGATADEAVKSLRAIALKCIVDGCMFATIEIPDMHDPLALAKAKGMVIEPPKSNHPHPLMKWAGTLDPNDPMVQEWRKAVEEYRREIDADPNR
jgi:hypothetical protein